MVAANKVLFSRTVPANNLLQLGYLLRLPSPLGGGMSKRLESFPKFDRLFLLGFPFRKIAKLGLFYNTFFGIPSTCLWDNYLL